MESEHPGLPGMACLETSEGPSANVVWAEVPGICILMSWLGHFRELMREGMRPSNHWTEQLGLRPRHY